MRLTNWLYIWVPDCMAVWHAAVVAQWVEVMGTTSPLRVRGVPVGEKPLGSTAVPPSVLPVQPVNVVVVPLVVEVLLELELELVGVPPALPAVPAPPPHPRATTSAQAPSQPTGGTLASQPTGGTEAPKEYRTKLMQEL
jgi:hypothetical protein